MRISIACVLLLAPVLADGADKAVGYDAFSVVRTRNIFDPNRRPPKKESEQARPVAPLRPRSVHLSLTGTMVTDDKTLAFFTGSRSEFNKIIGVGDKIGDFTIAAITSGQVDLDQGGKAVTLAVGKRLQLEGTEADAPETETAPPPAEGSSPPPAASADPAAPASSPASSPASNNPSDILKRMMERRAQEMKK